MEGEGTEQKIIVEMESSQKPKMANAQVSNLLKFSTFGILHHEMSFCCLDFRNQKDAFASFLDKEIPAILLLILTLNVQLLHTGDEKKDRANGNTSAVP